jgi:sugar phosphate permease
MKETPYKYLLSNPVNKWVMAGSFLRNVGGSAVTYYLPVFFLKNFPAFKAQYASTNALILSGLGLLSGILAGWFGDKYGKKNKMANAWICMSGTTIALPLYALATLQTGNFWLSMACHAIVTLFSAAFSGSAITMM